MAILVGHLIFWFILLLLSRGTCTWNALFCSIVASPSLLSVFPQIQFLQFLNIIILFARDLHSKTAAICCSCSSSILTNNNRTSPMPDATRTQENLISGIVNLARFLQSPFPHYHWIASSDRVRVSEWTWLTDSLSNATRTPPTTAVQEIVCVCNEEVHSHWQRRHQDCSFIQFGQRQRGNE